MHGAIAVGFDIGSLCSKIAVAKRGGVDVIANETSRRKTPTLVAFDGDRRYIGESAESGWKRNIKNTIFLFKRFLGRSFNEEDVQKEINRGLPFILKEVPETGEVGVQVNYDGESKLLSIKQIMGVYLAHLKDITEKSLEGKTKVSDVVVGVPCYWAESQRRAMVDAIKIAGLNPIELIEETTAIALNYGIYKLDLDEKNPINVVFYDLGHTSLQVSVVSFTKGTFKVLSTAYDQFLGGRDFDAVIVEKLLVMIKEKYKLDVKSDPRAFLRLELAARSLRETLSANPKSPFFIECLMQEKDISFEFTRDMFEELAKPLFERLLKPLEVALEKAGLKTENLYAVEVVGDTRATPKLQNLLNDYLGKITIGKTMNCSEAVAKGCGWQAARLSPLFSVRKITLQTFNLFEIQAEFDWIHPENGNNVVNKEIELTTLFPEKTVVPSSKLITIPKNNIPEKSTIEVNLSYNGSGIPNPTNNRHSNPKHFVKFNITNIPLNNENVSKSAIKVGLKMNDSGLCTISKVYKEYTETITYEAEEEVPIEEEKKEEQKMDTTEDKEEQKMDTTEETKSEEKTEEKKEEPKKEVTKPKTKKVKVQKKKDVVKTTHLQFEESSFSFPSKEINTLQDFEIKMQKQDTLIISTLVAKNAVESYINDLKYELSENMSEYIEEQAKETYITFLNDTENWLYEEGENAEKKVYEEKLEELKKTGDPVKNRYTQAQDRPFYVERLTSAINGVLEFANSDDIKHEHITLEERDQLRKIANEAKNWLDENLNIINNQAKHIDPPIYYAQIITRQEEVEKKSHPIMSKPKPVEEKKEQPQQPTTEEKPTTENTPTEVPPQTEENGEKMDTTEDKQN